MRLPTQLLPLALAVAAAAGIGACGDAGASFSEIDNWSGVDTTPTNPTDTAATDTGPTDTASDDSLPFDTAVDTTPELPPPPPPEEEVDFDLRTPEAGESFLYIPSAGLDALIVVDARSLAVEVVEVGVGPIAVRALPNDGGAIVLNAASSDVSIVKPDPSRDPPFSVLTLDVVPGANRLVISPHAELAFAWYDEHEDHTLGGVGGLQDVSAIRLAPGEETVMNLAVGRRPERVHFADNDSLVLIDCEDGISGAYMRDIVKNVFLTPVPTNRDPFRVPSDREIVTTPDGHFAVVRDLDHASLAWVDLQAGTLATLDLPGWATDLELTPDGKTLIATLPGLKEALVADLPDAFALPVADESNPHVHFVPTGAAFGATVLTADGRRALLYSTTPGIQAIGMLDIVALGAVIRPLDKEVRAVLVSPDSQKAALLHRAYSGSGSLATSHGYTVLDLASGYTKLITTPHEVTDVVFTDDATELYALVPDPARAAHEVHRVETGSFAVEVYPVPDAPVFVGALRGAHQVAISLANPTGWITFIDSATGTVRQLNSFELNGFIL